MVLWYNIDTLKISMCQIIQENLTGLVCIGMINGQVLTLTYCK